MRDLKDKYFIFNPGGIRNLEKKKKKHHFRGFQEKKYHQERTKFLLE